MSAGSQMTFGVDGHIQWISKAKYCQKNKCMKGVCSCPPQGERHTKEDILTGLTLAESNQSLAKVKVFWDLLLAESIQLVGQEGNISKTCLGSDSHDGVSRPEWVDASPRRKTMSLSSAAGQHL